MLGAGGVAELVRAMSSSVQRAAADVVDVYTNATYTFAPLKAERLMLAVCVHTSEPTPGNSTFTSVQVAALGAPVPL